MFGILGLGFLLGMQHALEADHIAAVSSIAARRTSVSEIVRLGLTWGLGHTITLFLLGPQSCLATRSPNIWLAPSRLRSALCWWRWEAMSFGGCGTTGSIFTSIPTSTGPCICIHGHAGDASPRTRDMHSHEHGFRWRSLLVGLMQRNGRIRCVVGSCRFSGRQSAVRHDLCPSFRAWIDDRNGSAVGSDRVSPCDVSALPDLGEPRPSGGGW